MIIKIINSDTSNGNNDISEYIGNIYETIPLSDFFKEDQIKYLNSIGSVLVVLDDNETGASLILKNEYEIIEN